MLAVVFALKYFKVYIYGRQVTVITDHKPLSAMVHRTEELASDRQQRWKMLILNFDVKVEYRKGTDNQAADALSRHPVAIVKEQEDNLLQRYDAERLEEIRKLQREDPELLPIFQFKEAQVVPDDERLARWLRVMDPRFHIVDEILFYVESEKDLKLRVVVPQSQRDAILWDLHCLPTGGHLGKERVLAKVAQLYYWPRYRQYVETYLRSCIICAARSGQGRHYRPPLQPVPVPVEPFVTVATDIVKLPLTLDGNRYALVITDLFSKFVMAKAMPDMQAETVVRAFLDGVLPFGAPQHVLTDQGTQFTSDLMKTACDCLQIHQLFTTTFHPQCDGQTERANQTLEAMLSKCSSARGDDWDRQLAFVVYAYNSSKHSSTKNSPFHTLFGREPRSPSSNVFAVVANYYTREHDDDFKTMLPHYLKMVWEIVREESEKAKTRQKTQYDKHCTQPPFQVGDKVFVNSKEMIRTKLSPKYKGPFTIISVTPTNAWVVIEKGNRTLAKRKVHLDKLTRAHPEIGDRVFTGDMRRPLQPPSGGSSAAGTASPVAGGEEDLGTKSPDVKKGKAEANPVQPHAYNLRPRAVRKAPRSAVRLVRCRPSVLIKNQNFTFQRFQRGQVARICSFQIRMSVSNLRSDSQYAPRRRIILHSERQPRRFAPYSFNRHLSARSTREPTVNHRVQLRAEEEPALASYRETLEAGHLRPNQCRGVGYRPPRAKVPGVDYVPIPLHFPFQQESFYRSLPYRVQAAMFHNPYTEVELKAEVLRRVPVRDSLLVDTFLLNHLAYVPECPVQFDVVQSRFDLREKLNELTSNSVQYFALSVGMLPETPGVPFTHWPKDIRTECGLIPRNPHSDGPFALYLQIVSEEMVCLLIDLREASMMATVRGTRMIILCPELDNFLKDRHHIFLTTCLDLQSSALTNTFGEFLLRAQFPITDRRSGDSIFAIDLGAVAHAVAGFGRAGQGLHALMEYTQSPDGKRYILPEHFCKVVDHLWGLLPDMARRAFLGSLSPDFCTTVAHRASFIMYAAYHLVLRNSEDRLSAALLPLQSRVITLFGRPTVATAEVPLSQEASNVYGDGDDRAKEVATRLWKQAERLRKQRYCLWWSGAPIIKETFSDFASQLSARYQLSARQRMFCLYRFLQKVGVRWRLNFAPTKPWQAGADIRGTSSSSGRT